MVIKRTSIPQIIFLSPSGGCFEFDDGGIYCGSWQDGRAHNHGVCTGPQNVGVFSGFWNYGFEVSGVFKGKNGAIYEGRWQNGKRHGVGILYNGRWIYKGQWTQGLKEQSIYLVCPICAKEGRYGVKTSSNSAVRYEGTWTDGLQDGSGSERYSDGGYYQGDMCRGLRHGYGVRRSAPYGIGHQLHDDTNKMKSSYDQAIVSSGSVQFHHQSGMFDSMPDAGIRLEDDTKSNIDRTLASQNGFVLVRKAKGNLTDNITDSRRSSSVSNSSIFKGLGRRSVSDVSGRLDSGETDPLRLTAKELDIKNPATVETYSGQWRFDKRNGYGVCERSDGLRYEGQWHNDMKCGYGVTTFEDGSKEEGKYKSNILIADNKARRFLHLRSSTMRQRIEDSVRLAHRARTKSLQRAEVANTRADIARDKADQASTAALEADRDSQIAFSVARQYSDNFQQQQQADPNNGLLVNYYTAIQSAGYDLGDRVLSGDCYERMLDVSKQYKWQKQFSQQTFINRPRGYLDSILYQSADTRDRQKGQIFNPFVRTNSFKLNRSRSEITNTGNPDRWSTGQLKTTNFNRQRIRQAYEDKTRSSSELPEEINKSNEYSQDLSHWKTFHPDKSDSLALEKDASDSGDQIQSEELESNRFQIDFKSFRSIKDFILKREMMIPLIILINFILIEILFV